MSLIFKTQSPVGTLLYNGPLPNTAITGVSDFMLLEIVDGKLKLHINFGSGVRMLELEQQVILIRRSIDFKKHWNLISRVYNKTCISMKYLG